MSFTVEVRGLENEDEDVRMEIIDGDQQSQPTQENLDGILGADVFAGHRFNFDEESAIAAAPQSVLEEYDHEIPDLRIRGWQEYTPDLEFSSILSKLQELESHSDSVQTIDVCYSNESFEESDADLRIAAGGLLPPNAREPASRWDNPNVSKRHYLNAPFTTRDPAVSPSNLSPSNRAGVFIGHSAVAEVHRSGNREPEITEAFVLTKGDVGWNGLIEFFQMGEEEQEARFEAEDAIDNVNAEQIADTIREVTEDQLDALDDDIKVKQHEVQRIQARLSESHQRQRVIESYIPDEVLEDDFTPIPDLEDELMKIISIDRIAGIAPKADLNEIMIYTEPFEYLRRARIELDLDSRMGFCNIFFEGMGNGDAFYRQKVATHEQLSDSLPELVGAGKYSIIVQQIVDLMDEYKEKYA